MPAADGECSAVDHSGTADVIPQLSGVLEIDLKLCDALFRSRLDAVQEIRDESCIDRIVQMTVQIDVRSTDLPLGYSFCFRGEDLVKFFKVPRFFRIAGQGRCENLFHGKGPVGVPVQHHPGG